MIPLSWWPSPRGITLSPAWSHRQQPSACLKLRARLGRALDAARWLLIVSIKRRSLEDLRQAGLVEKSNEILTGRSQLEGRWTCRPGQIDSRRRRRSRSGSIQQEYHHSRQLTES